PSAEWRLNVHSRGKMAHDKIEVSPDAEVSMPDTSPIRKERRGFLLRSTGQTEFQTAEVVEMADTPSIICKFSLFKNFHIISQVTIKSSICAPSLNYPS